MNLSLLRILKREQQLESEILGWVKGQSDYVALRFIDWEVERISGTALPSCPEPAAPNLPANEGELLKITTILRYKLSSINAPIAYHQRSRWSLDAHKNNCYTVLYESSHHGRDHNWQIIIEDPSNVCHTLMSYCFAGGWPCAWAAYLTITVLLHAFCGYKQLSPVRVSPSRSHSRSTLSITTWRSAHTFTTTEAWCRMCRVSWCSWWGISATHYRT